MYYEQIHEMVRKAAADQDISIGAILKAHGFPKPTFYYRLRYGTSWRSDEIKKISDMTGKSAAEILEQIL